MAQRAAVRRSIAVSREGTPASSRFTSREATPRNSRPASRYSSREMLSDGLINRMSNGGNPLTPDRHLDNQMSNAAMVNGNYNGNMLSPSRNGHSGRSWYGSGSNLTSSDSTPSSENTLDSGQVTDTSPVGPLAALGFSETDDAQDTCLYHIPIVGYEVLEERSRFTIFKIQVLHQPTGDQWFVFRRYTDFTRLNKKLKSEFPGLRFALPPKKWFGDNFDPVFLEDRQLGLQAFIDNIIGHARIREKKSVRDFFCLDDPPGAHDTLEESRAMCQSLEDNVADLQEQLRDKDSEINVLRSQVNFLVAQQQTLVKALRLECELHNDGEHQPGTTHELNLALLNICEKSLNGSLSNSNLMSPARNGDGNTPGATTHNTRVNTTRITSVESPLQRTLEKVFLPSQESQSSLTMSGSGTQDTSVDHSGDVSQER